MVAEFIAAVQIVVYVGGIVVLIIFSIFLTQKAGSEMPKPVRSRAFFAALAVLLGFILSYTLIYQYNFQPASTEPLNVSVSDIGAKMLSTSKGGYALPFEVVSVLLLAAMIGCIVIAMKSPLVVRKENIELQQPNGNGYEYNVLPDKILETENE